jgi:hypothetical protein
LLQTAMLWPACRTVTAARQEFWEGKDPAAWSSEERDLLLGQSPWAREGTVRFEIDKKRRGNGGVAAVPRPGGDVPGARPHSAPGAPPSVPIGDAPPKAPSAEKGPPVEFRVLARWESAQPVRLAGGPELPEEAAGFYVIRLRGMPLLPPRKNKDGTVEPNPNLGLLDAIKRNTRIERKDKPAIPCSHLLTGSGDAATELLLFFAKGADPIAVREKAVTLVSHFDPFSLSIKFPLKEMMYKGALAL